MKYATVLLEHCPKDTTQLFIDYYTAQFRPKKDAVVIPNAPAPQGSLGIASTAVQNLAALIPLPYMNASSNVQTPSSTDQRNTLQIVETNVNDPPAEYPVPKPRTAFSAFVDHPEEFVVFLEACIQSDELKEEDKIDLYTTLFEMYLHTANGKKNGEREEWENKAKKLIEGKNVTLPFSSRHRFGSSHDPGSDRHLERPFTIPS